MAPPSPSSSSDFPARGKVLEVRGDSVIFQPAATTYELHLKVEGEPYAGPLKQPVQALIRLAARKVYTVPSGGAFIAPIFGPPRIVQGRVRFADERVLVLQAAASAPVIVDLPGQDSAIDLTEGRIRANHLVNVAALPGATFHLLTQPATAVT